MTANEIAKEHLRKMVLENDNQTETEKKGIKHTGYGLIGDLGGEGGIW
jgi:hypothetical protein